MEADEYSNISELVGNYHDNDDDNVADCGDFSGDDEYEELPEDIPVMCSSNSLNRANGAAKSSWGGSARAPDERIDSAKILDMKTKLRPTVTKVQDSRNNNTGDNEVSVMKSVTKSNRLGQNNTTLVKAQTPSTPEVGCGEKSVRIVNIKNSLRPVLSRKDNNDRQIDDNDKDSVDGSHFNERSLPVATPSVASKFNPPHRQSPEASSDTRPQTTTSTKASSFPKFTPFAKSPNNDSLSEAIRNARPIRPTNAGASSGAASRPLFAQSPPSTAPKTSATRSTSAIPATNAAVRGDGFEPPSQHRLIRKAASHGRSDDNNRFNNNQFTRQDNESALASQKWYFGGIGRDISEEMLGKMFNETGSYLVRDCYSGGRDSPYALSVVHNRRIYHMIIRRRSVDDKFSLGKPKENEKVFNSVIEMITFHQNNPIELIDESNKRTVSGRVTLKNCPPKDQL